MHTIVYSYARGVMVRHCLVLWNPLSIRKLLAIVRRAYSLMA